jgi:hypothetical protein
VTAGQRARRVVASRVATARARLRAERSLAGWDRAQRIALPSLDPGRVPVVFCTWRRLGRLGRTLDQLSAQDLPVQALIWNNSGEREPVDIAAATARIPVFTYHSPRNIGGFGRFYLARELAAAGHRSVVLIDDDQDFGPSAVSDLASMHRPGSLSGWWAFRFRGSGYGDRARVAAGEPASYVGTGGMIADTSVFLDGVLFDCPRRFWFVDDLWLCYVARQLCGYELFGSAALFECGEDEHALYRTLGRTKWQFLRYLIRQGWDPAPGSAVTPG